MTGPIALTWARLSTAEQVTRCSLVCGGHAGIRPPSANVYSLSCGERTTLHRALREGELKRKLFRGLGIGFFQAATSLCVSLLVTVDYQ
mmetsp:Transcript_7553/g.15369  ORF Transcript_7553/g.15369 Transcript_7553/m.15369 type:complete len:89 (+) Transcript_7553:578-844(+)